MIDAVTAALFLATAAAAIMAIRGSLPLLLVPGAAVALALTVGALSLAAAASLRAYDRLLARLPGRQLLWLVPLTDLALAFAALSLPLALPGWLGDHEFWKDVTGIPPTPFTRLVTLMFGLIGLQVAYVFARLLARYLADPRSWHAGPRDNLTSLVFASGLVVLACVLLYGQAHRPQNIVYMQGWYALGAGGRPADAFRAFAEVVERYPDSGFADAALYRMARIEADDLGHPAEAVSHLRQLLARWPDSSLADDALEDLGELSLGPLKDPAAAEKSFAELRRRFPRSYLCERATLGHARALARLARAADATRLLDDLERAPHRTRIVTEDEDGAPRVQATEAALAEVRAGLGK